MGVLEIEARLSSKWTLAILIAATVRVSAYKPGPDWIWTSMAQRRLSLPSGYSPGVTAELHRKLRIHLVVILGCEATTEWYQDAISNFRMHGAKVDKTRHVCRRSSSWASTRSKDGGTGLSQVREGSFATAGASASDSFPRPVMVGAPYAVACNACMTVNR